MNVTSEIITVKLGFKERLDKEKLGNSEPGPITNMPVHLINSEPIGFSVQLCDNKKVKTLYTTNWMILFCLS